MDRPKGWITQMSVLPFSTKGKTLEDLSGVITTAKVLPLLRFSISNYENNIDNFVNNIQNFFKTDLLVIRSSAKNEDNLDSSNAGHFKSILNVPKNDNGAIIEAINEVIASYDTLDDSNEILIQPMLSNIKLSGVVFTADMDTLAPYYIINYDESGKTDTITGGIGSNIKTYIYYKNVPFQFKNPYLLKLCNACRELEKIFDYQYLDIEFAFDQKGDLYIFQCRPIAIKNKENLSQIKLQDSLSKIYTKFEQLSAPHPNLLGDRTTFGVMPDWNPAEIIGLRPKELARSLYKELVTDNMWAYQRDNYGYRNLRSHPLMISFSGVPFIDVRVDFNSFVPKNLNENISEKLVECYLNKLESTPTHHDKIEFFIVHSCYYLNLPDKLKELLNYGFNENEIKRIEFSLLDLTNQIIDPEHGLYKKDIEKMEKLILKYDSIIDSSLPIIEKIHWLVEDCKRYGTLPFAGVARAAFIGVQFLKSFVDIGILTQNESDRFMNSLNTVAKKLNSDLCKLSKGDISKDEFLSEYGHLRPGTYDILSMRYDENYEHYFSTINNEYCETVSYEFSYEQITKIDMTLLEHGLKINAVSLIQFIKEAIEGREYAKFVFTKSLSQILSLIGELGKDLGISREELAHLDIKNVLNMYSILDRRDLKDILRSNIEQNTELYNYTKAIKLPSLIRKPKDVYGFYLENEAPNFITLNKITSHIINEDEFGSGKFENRIAFIKSADPGYDFLFTKNIAGLVTLFGGANSHMAIRCAELGIPAVIGAGEKNFAEWSKAKMLEIDCANKQVRVNS